jgi:murein DD-endopeptidase MepM/ murein hydrolase activator NlpD
MGGVVCAGGDTGYVTRPQLHFEIRKDRKPLYPMTKLPTV